MVSLDVERNPKNVPTVFRLRFVDVLPLKLWTKKISPDF